MSREELLISLSKSNQSIAELRRSKDNNAEIEETKKIFNELRNRFSKEKIKKITRKFCFREEIGEYLKQLEKKQFNGARKTREKTSHQKNEKG